jgi:hypothetical protein
MRLLSFLLGCGMGSGGGAEPLPVSLVLFRRCSGLDGSAIGFAAVADVVDRDGVFRLVEDHAMVADPETKQAFQFTAEWFDLAGAAVRVAVNGRQNVQGGALFDGADFGRDIRMEADLLHWDGYSPLWWRTWSMVKPHSATTCSKAMPLSGLSRK